MPTSAITVELMRHGLSCRKSEGRHQRGGGPGVIKNLDPTASHEWKYRVYAANMHAAVNDIIHKSLISARVPARMEPSGLSRSDGKRPDGVTSVPGKSGKLLVWDVTCPDTFAPSYAGQAQQWGKWQPRLNSGNVLSIVIFLGHTPLSQLLSKRRGYLVNGPCNFSRSWAGLSGNSLGTQTPHPFCSSASHSTFYI